MSSGGKTAVVFGGSGLIGYELLQLLCADSSYAEVKVFTRRPLNLKKHNIDEIITDFKDLDTLRAQVKGDVVFCCLGTTINTAGSEKAFRAVDFDLVRWAAVSAAENKVPQFLVISSIGANADSKNFYLRTKGEMEKAVTALSFKQCVVLRPSMLLGPRKEFRFGESIGKVLMRLFAILVPARYKAIQASQVAKAMQQLAAEGTFSGVMENELILKMK